MNKNAKSTFLALVIFFTVSMASAQNIVSDQMVRTLDTISVNTSRCLVPAVTEVGMLRCQANANLAYRGALEAMITAMLSAFEGDSSYTSKMTMFYSSQEKWSDYVDAACDFENIDYEGGSSYLRGIVQCKSDKIFIRINELRTVYNTYMDN